MYFCKECNFFALFCEKFLTTVPIVKLKMKEKFVITETDFTKYCVV